jgi:hypothetical protein
VILLTINLPWGIFATQINTPVLPPEINILEFVLIKNDVVKGLNKLFRLDPARNISRFGGIHSCHMCNLSEILLASVNSTLGMEI